MNTETTILTGWDIWEAYFCQQYGPDYDESRLGRYPVDDECNCLYCSRDERPVYVKSRVVLDEDEGSDL